MEFRVRSLKSGKYKILFSKVDEGIMKTLLTKSGVTINDNDEAYITNDAFPEIESFLKNYKEDDKKDMSDLYNEINIEVLRQSIIDISSEYSNTFDEKLYKELMIKVQVFLTKIKYEGIGKGEIFAIKRNNIGYVIDYCHTLNTEYLERYKKRCRL